MPTPISRPPQPVVIAHRGASGHLPEHTLEAYRLAAALGADFIEPDLVITADGVLVARHENEISDTTDVARRPEFADRRTRRTLDGRDLEGWFVEDFTLAELRTLRARERIPHLRPASAAHDGRFGVPTFEEVLGLRAELEAATGRPIGVYPETKHPAYLRSIGLPLEPPLLEALARHGLDRAGAPVFIQSFEEGNLRALAGLTDLPLVQLLRRPAAGAQLRAIAGYAAAVGPRKEHATAAFVAAAHAAGLLVHPYTYRRENAFLPPERRSSDDPAAPGDLEGELRAAFAAGVDGVFTDHPEVAARVLAGGGAA